MLRLNFYSPATYKSDLSVQQLIQAMQRANDPEKKFMNAKTTEEEKSVIQLFTITQSVEGLIQNVTKYYLSLKFLKNMP